MRDSNIAMTEPETTPDETGVPGHLHGGQNVHESAVAAGEAVVHTAVLTNAVETPASEEDDELRRINLTDGFSALLAHAVRERQEDERWNRAIGHVHSQLRQRAAAHSVRNQALSNPEENQPVSYNHSVWPGVMPGWAPSRLFSS